MEKKTMKQLMLEKSWKVEGLKVKLNLTDKEIQEWEKLNKPLKKSKKK